MGAISGTWYIRGFEHRTPLLSLYYLPQTVSCAKGGGGGPQLEGRKSQMLRQTHCAARQICVFFCETFFPDRWVVQHVRCGNLVIWLCTGLFYSLFRRANTRLSQLFWPKRTTIRNFASVIVHKSMISLLLQKRAPRFNLIVLQARNGLCSKTPGNSQNSIINHDRLAWLACSEMLMERA